MQTISPQLFDFLQTHTAYNKADLFMIELANGQVITATTSQSDILFGPNNQSPFFLQKYFSSLQGAWERGPVTSELSYAPKSNSMQLSVVAKASVMYPGSETTLMETVAAGLFDAARVHVFTVFWEIGGRIADGVAMGYLTTFLGEVAKVASLTRMKATFDVADMLYRLNQQVPLNVIETSCRHTLFNANCTLVKDNFAFPNIVAAGSTSLQINLTNDVTTASFWNGVITFTQGQIFFTSGRNKGLRGYIKKQMSTTQILLAAPMPFAVVPTDTFIMYPGCDLSIAMCQNGYNNLIHIGSMPFVPNPEWAM